MSRTAALHSSSDVSAVVRPLCPQTREELTHELSEKYVYLYRDPETFEIRYVGLATIRKNGKGKQRPEEHLTCKQQTCEVRPWVQGLRAHGRSPVIEVINCGDDEARAKAVEGALISALWTSGERPLLNHIHGHGERFRPLGSPRSVAGRRLLDPLTRSDIAQLGPALVVNLSIEDFTDTEVGEDGREIEVRRPGAGTFSALTDRKVRERIQQWWQIGGLREEWHSGDRPAPRLVIGVMGPVQHKWVYGAMLVDQKRIGAMVRERGGLYSVPVKSGVDAAHLRGRVLAPYEFGPRENVNGRVFGSVRAHQFDWVQ